MLCLHGAMLVRFCSLCYVPEACWCTAACGPPECLLLRLPMLLQLIKYTSPPKKHQTGRALLLP